MLRICRTPIVARLLAPSLAACPDPWGSFRPYPRSARQPGGGMKLSEVVLSGAGFTENGGPSHNAPTQPRPCQLRTASLKPPSLRQRGDREPPNRASQLPTIRPSSYAVLRPVTGQLGCRRGLVSRSASRWAGRHGCRNKPGNPLNTVCPSLLARASVISIEASRFKWHFLIRTVFHSLERRRLAFLLRCPLRESLTSC